MATPGVQAPARLGRYELIARLATGGMGEIFLARLEGAAGFEKLFVVKRILPHLADDARFRGMLIAEARIASKMAHANICQVYELGETEGQLYIVMEYLEGATLLPLLRRASRDAAPLELGFIAAVIQQTTDALHYAHELRDRDGESLGIVHRDVTPSNVFLTETGVAKVLDFGIAKVKNASAQTQTGTVKGKYAYMAPEQLRGVAVDRRADVFALGILGYEMIALRRLFQRKTDYLTFRAVMEQPLPDVRRYRPDLPDAVAEVLVRALDRDPDRRFATARQLGTALLDALGGAARPWTQGEVSDYLRARFADEVEKLGAVVANVLHRTKPGGRMPLQLGTADGPPIPSDEDDDEDDFPSVESTLSDAPPLEAMRAQARASSPAGDFVGQTPPPFGGESSTSGVALQPLAAPGGAPATVVVARRGMLWPLLALAMVAIAGAALFLVYQQTQAPRPPAVVNITTTPANVPEAPPAAPAGSAEAAEAGEAPGDADADAVGDVTEAPAGATRATPRSVARPRRVVSPYNQAIQASKPKINACARQHGVPPGDAQVVIVVAASGKPKTVSLEPAALDRTPLGGCIKNVLSVATFPPAKSEMRVAVALKAN